MNPLTTLSRWNAKNAAMVFFGSLEHATGERVIAETKDLISTIKSRPGPWQDVPTGIFRPSERAPGQMRMLSDEDHNLVWKTIKQRISGLDWPVAQQHELVQALSGAEIFTRSKEQLGKGDYSNNEHLMVRATAAEIEELCDVAQSFAPEGHLLGYFQKAKNQEDLLRRVRLVRDELSGMPGWRGIPHESPSLTTTLMGAWAQFRKDTPREEGREISNLLRTLRDPKPELVTPKRARGMRGN